MQHDLNTISAPCGFTTDATNVNQPLNSPGFPREYERNKDCVWNINARSGQQIQVNFTNFETERCCDYVKVGVLIAAYYVLLF